MTTSFALDGPLPEGTVLLEASAGTGKTHAIAALATRFLAAGQVRPEHLAVITFSRVASQELRFRVRSRIAATTALLTARLAGESLPHWADPADAILASGDPADLAARRARLLTALRDFDTASIMTIHEFCQAMTHGLGIQAAQDPEATVVADLAPLRAEVVRDLYLARYADRTGNLPFGFAAAQDLGRDAVEVSEARLVHPGGGTAQAERLSFAQGVRHETAARKHRLGLITFDDQLTRLRDALVGETGQTARARLRSRIRVALVDEFQDTDPVQWQILELAFHGHSTLVLIGDPKQSIYAFRGADVAAYARATAQADARHGLTVNHRSDQPVVSALDAFFAGVRLGPGIEVPHVDAARPGSRLLLPPGSPWRAPVRIRTAAGEPFLTPEQARRRIGADLVAQVLGLLAPGAARLADDGGERELRAGDIAVLVRTNQRGRTLAQQLSAAGVAVAFTGSNSIFGSTSAGDWLTLLRALDQPRRGAVRAALLTDFVGVTLNDLALADEDTVAEWTGMIHRWARVQRDAGIAALFATIEQDTGFAGRVLSRRLGERDLTDARHVAQLLHDQTLTGVTGGALADWLETELTARDATGERTRRLETDAEAVQIMTVHRAKGLQFPVVLVPEAADRPIAKDDGGKLVYHDPEGTRVLDLSGLEAPDRELRLAAHRAEEAADSLRTLYVAATRAQSQLTLWWARTRYRTAASPLHRMLFRRRDLTAEPEAEYPVDQPPGDAHPDSLEWLAPAGILVEDASILPGPAPAAAPREPAALSARRWQRQIDGHWRRTSYSGLTANVHGQQPLGGMDDEPPAPADLDTLDRAGASAPGEEGPLSPMAALPGGAVFGTAVHSVLESLDWYAPTPAQEDALRDRLTSAAAETLRRHPLGEISAPALAEALLPSLITPLGSWAQERCLAQIRITDRLSELAFEMPLGTSGASATLADVADLLHDHLPADDALAAYPQALRTDGLAEQTLRGFLTGSIDAVLRLGGPHGVRFVVVDYKTNRLSALPELRLDHYRQQPMAAEMVRSHYPLQALLYQVALHRFLTQRMPGYRPEEHLGGAAYLFVRGLAGRHPIRDGGLPTGVFHWQPPASLVADLSTLLSAGGLR